MLNALSDLPWLFSRSNTLVVPDLEPAAIYCSEILKATDSTGEVWPSILYPLYKDKWYPYNNLYTLLYCTHQDRLCLANGPYRYLPVLSACGQHATFIRRDCHRIHIGPVGYELI